MTEKKFIEGMVMPTNADGHRPQQITELSEGSLARPLGLLEGVAKRKGYERLAKVVETQRACVVALDQLLTAREDLERTKVRLQPQNLEQLKQIEAKKIWIEHAQQEYQYKLTMARLEDVGQDIEDERELKRLRFLDEKQRLERKVYGVAGKVESDSKPDINIEVELNKVNRKIIELEEKRRKGEEAGTWSDVDEMMYVREASVLNGRAEKLTEAAIQADL